MALPAVPDDLPTLPRDDAGPVFRAPWEAHAFALAVRLAEAGYFSWSEWSRALADEIGTAQERGSAEGDEGYYQHWLSALEGLCIAKRLVNSLEEMERRKQEWRRAYLHTPHGQPVKLSAGRHME
jgi:nitrile hydratase accessory protein